MRRRRSSFAIVAMLALCSLLLIWWSRLDRKPASGQGEVPQMAQQLLSDPAKFANDHFKGGIGAVLSVQATSGLSVIIGVLSGSPAEKAGLKEGDVILEIDGTSTKGQSLVQIVEKLRGFAITSVDLVIQRDGTNLSSVVSRSSWKNLQDGGTLKVRPSPGSAPMPGPQRNGPDPIRTFDPFTFPPPPTMVQTNF